MLRVAVTLSLVVIARGFVVDSVGGALTSALGVILNGGHPPQTVTELVDSKYLGRWYQASAQIVCLSLCLSVLSVCPVEPAYLHVSLSVHLARGLQVPRPVVPGRCSVCLCPTGFVSFLSEYSACLSVNPKPSLDSWTRST